MRKYSDIESGQLWMHIESGRTYCVVLMVKRESDGESMVCYQLAPEAGPVWVRPLYEFEQHFVPRRKRLAELEP